MGKATIKTTRMCASCSAVVDASLPICAGCRPKLMAEVRDANDLIRELGTDLARQSRKGGNNVGRKTSDTPVYYNTSASDAIAELRASIHGLAREATPEGVRRFRDARHRAWQIVDIPPTRKFVGVCYCTTDGIPIYAPPNADTAPCPRCGDEWVGNGEDDWDHLAKVVQPLESIRRHMLTLGFQRSRRQLTRDITKFGVEPVETVNDVRMWRLTDVLWASHRNGAQRIAA